MREAASVIVLILCGVGFVFYFRGRILWAVAYWVAAVAMAIAIIRVFSPTVG